MNDKIEVGEYVRSNLGTIGKVTKIEDGKFLYENKCLICFITNVVKHSKNIIDLIEVGDYVNGMLVTNVMVLDKNSDYIPTTIIFCNRDENCTLQPVRIYEQDIKSIATKENFSSIEYKI